MGRRVGVWGGFDLGVRGFVGVGSAVGFERLYL